MLFLFVLVAMRCLE